MRSSSGRSRSIRRRSVTAMAGSLRGEEEEAWGGGDVFLGLRVRWLEIYFVHSPRVSDAGKLLIRNLHVKACRNSPHSFLWLLLSQKCRGKISCLFPWPSFVSQY